MNGESLNILEDRLEKLKTDFPEIFIEGENLEVLKVLPKYISCALVQIDFDLTKRNELKAGNAIGDQDNPTTWGNEALYKKIITSEIDAFVTSDKRILTLNPDLHYVSKAARNT